jgi:hypothetical protein
MAGAGGSAPYRWTGEQVEVVHHDNNNSRVLSVGTTGGVLEEVDEEGLVLRVPGEGEGAKETHYFPRSSVIKIVLTDAPQ